MSFSSGSMYVQPPLSQYMSAGVSLQGTATPIPIPGAQMYTVTDLGTLGGDYSFARSVNASGQVVGSSFTSTYYYHAFRTAPNSPINPATDDLGTLLASGR
jgi:probable HAF family extracellular repeat protein